MRTPVAHKRPRLKVVRHSLDDRPRRVRVLRFVSEESQRRDDRAFVVEFWTDAEWAAMAPHERPEHAAPVPGIGYFKLVVLTPDHPDLAEYREAEREMVDVQDYREGAACY